MSKLLSQARKNLKNSHKIYDFRFGSTSDKSEEGEHSTKNNFFLISLEPLEKILEFFFLFFIAKFEYDNCFFSYEKNVLIAKRNDDRCRFLQQT